MMTANLLFLNCAALWLLAWTACASAQTAVSLDPKTVQWSVDGKEVAIRHIISPVAEGVLRGGIRTGADIDGDLVAVEEPGRGEVWQLKAEKARRFVPVHFAEDAIFFQTWTRSPKKSDDRAKIAESRSLHRVAIKTGKQSTPFSMPDDTAEDEYVAAVDAQDGVVFAVSLAPAKQGGDFYEQRLSHTHVIAWKEDGGPPLWSKKIEYREASSPGAALLSPGGPDYAATGLRLISAGPGVVFVCTGPHDSISAFELKTGKTLWSQPELWEYRRGFIGPSVWSYFIDRFGHLDMRRWVGNDTQSDPDAGLRDDAKTDILTELQIGFDDPKTKKPDFKKRVDERFATLIAERKKAKADVAARCRIIGGPVFVGKGDNARVFVAVSEADGEWGGYLSTCRVYELSAATGEPVAIIHLPRDVLGTDVKVIGDGVIWHCQGSALARLRVSTVTPDVGMGGNKFDCLGQLVWYREIPGSEMGETAWLQTGTSGAPWIFSESSVLRIPAGGFVRKKGETTMHFPIEKLDMTTGKTIRALLSIGYSPALKRPKTNYTQSPGPDGKEQIRTREIYGAAITRIEAEGDDLILTVATESGGSVRVIVPAL